MRLQKAFHVNFDDRQYTACAIQTFPTREEIRDRAKAVPQPAAQPEPTVLVETETVDTRERKELFGRPARHVITTRRVIPLTGSSGRESQTVTDGWYIDLDTALSCDPWWRSSGSGHAFVTTHRHGEQPESQHVSWRDTPASLIERLDELGVSRTASQEW